MTPNQMLLNGNHIFTLKCKTARHDMIVASDNFQEIQCEAIVLCKATNEDVNIYCHGTASNYGTVTPEFVALYH